MFVSTQQIIKILLLCSREYGLGRILRNGQLALAWFYDLVMRKDKRSETPLIWKQKLGECCSCFGEKENVVGSYCVNQELACQCMGWMVDAIARWIFLDALVSLMLGRLDSI